MKKLARQAVAAVLGYQVRKLRNKNDFKVVAVAGSIGKTSTKLAIAEVLKQGFKVQYQEGNYNDLVTVPLVFFGQNLPSLFNPLAWLALFWRNQKLLGKPFPYELVVIELGSDGPGQITQFKKYLKVEICVITAITPEHMEYFGNLDQVAKEELAIGQISDLVLANSDLSDSRYLKQLPDVLTYAIKNDANYSLDVKNNTLMAGGEKLLGFDGQDLSEPELYSLLAAAAVALKLSMGPAEIKKGLSNIKPFAGRMQKLAGTNNSTIIDDSYNSSPSAAKLALDSLYKIDAPQKIAVLGNMNELGEYSKAAHQEIGRYCDPDQLDMLLTIGPDANEYLAEAAEAKGCKVQSFDNPYTAGDYLKPLIKKNAVILVKGSQNKVFAEETIKSLLANPADSAKLVRQEAAWMAVKKKAFGR